MVLRWMALRRSLRGSVGARRWATNGPGAPPPPGPPPPGPNTVTSARTATPGTVRIRRGTDPRAEEVEMDTTIARIMGSDWGDRRKQPVSYAMKLYWGIFIVVLANGAYTYFTGKDESYLVEKVQKKVDERLGRVETDEFVVMADQKHEPQPQQQQRQPTTTTTTTTTKREDAASAVVETTTAPPTRSPPPSIFGSSMSPTTMPFLRSQATQPRQRTRDELVAELEELRQRQVGLRLELKEPRDSQRSLNELQLEIQRIDLQKAQIKLSLKAL